MHVSSPEPRITYLRIKRGVGKRRVWGMGKQEGETETINTAAGANATADTKQEAADSSLVRPRLTRRAGTSTGLQNTEHVQAPRP